MNSIPSAHTLLFDQLRDMHSMETQLLKATPRLAAFSHHPSLRSLILSWHDDIDVQCVEISEIFARHHLSPGTDQCMATKCIIECGEADLQAVKDFFIRDLMMVAHCLRLSRYAITSCDITSRLADRLELTREAKILTRMQERECEAADELLELEKEIFEIAFESDDKISAQ